MSPSEEKISAVRTQQLELIISMLEQFHDKAVPINRKKIRTAIAIVEASELALQRLRERPKPSKGGPAR
jgi:hypothetical protein